MIYNLVQYLKTQFPADIFYANAIILISGQDEIPDRKALIQETGGQVQMKTGYTQASCQVVVFDIDSVGARKFATDIFNELNDRNGLLLPQVTVNSIIHAEVETGCIKAIQRPQFLRCDDDGLYVWTTNYIIKFVE